MAENMLIHGYTSKHHYLRLCHSLVDDFVKLKNGIEVYNALTGKVQSCSHWVIHPNVLIFVATTITQLRRVVHIVTPRNRLGLFDPSYWIPTSS